jgi:hypothetical protein
MKLDLSEAVGYALTAPAGQMDLSLWERFYLQGIDSLMKLIPLFYVLMVERVKLNRLLLLLTINPESVQWLQYKIF